MAQDTNTVIMGRIRKEIEVAGRKCWTLFDPETRQSYITSEAAANLLCEKLRQPRQTSLTGVAQQIQEICLVIAKLEGYSVDFLAHVVDEIGRDEHGCDIDILFGSLAMKQWGITPDLATGRLDLTHYGSTFVEY